MISLTKNWIFYFGQIILLLVNTKWFGNHEINKLQKNTLNLNYV